MTRLSSNCQPRFGLRGGGLVEDGWVALVPSPRVTSPLPSSLTSSLHVSCHDAGRVLLCHVMPRSVFPHVMPHIASSFSSRCCVSCHVVSDELSLCVLCTRVSQAHRPRKPRISQRSRRHRGLASKGPHTRVCKHRGPASTKALQVHRRSCKQSVSQVRKSRKHCGLASEKVPQAHRHRKNSKHSSLASTGPCKHGHLSCKQRVASTVVWQAAMVSQKQG